MSTQHPPDESGPLPGLARRSVLRGAAGLGAVGLAAAAGVGAAAAAIRPAHAADATARAATAPSPVTAARANGTDPLVVYLRDASAGEFDVFQGTKQVKVRNPRLVAQLLDGIATAQ